MSFVPPPPPGVVVPTPPVATPASATADAPGSPQTKVVKPGGVALDMSDLFGPPKNGKKKALPPWERKKATTPPPEGARKSATTPPTAGSKAKSPPLPGKLPQPSTVSNAEAGSKLALPSATETSYPSLSSLPAKTNSLNAPAAVARKSVPSAPLVASPVASSPPPTTNLTMHPAAAAVPAGSSPAPLPASNPLPASTASPSAVPPMPPSQATAQAGGVPAAVSAEGVAQSVASPAGVTAAAAPSTNGGGAVETQPAPPLPGSDPAAMATSARIVEEALRDMRMHLATPSHTVVAPHVMFQGKEQKVAVSPLGPVPPRKEKGKKGAAATKPKETSSADYAWYNAFDVRPSPSCDPAYRQVYASAGGAKPAPREWRGAYFQNVDVHRYVARRYFGVPPPVEH